jgi:hypothetical protein
VLEGLNRPPSTEAKTPRSRRDRDGPRCQEHGLDFRYVCTEDDALICMDCYALQHGGHRCQALAAAYEDERVASRILLHKASTLAQVRDMGRGRKGRVWS